MFTFDNDLGRFDQDPTLIELLELRDSLTAGIVPGDSVTVTDRMATLDAPIDSLIRLLKENKNETGILRKVEGVDGQTLVDRLEALRTLGTFPCAVDGRRRCRVVLLDAAIRGVYEKTDFLQVQQTEVEDLTPEEEEALALRKGTLPGTAASWKARTAWTADLIRKGQPLKGLEGFLKGRQGWKRGTCQHAAASGQAVVKWSLDLKRCTSLTAGDWRKLLADNMDRPTAESLAYGSATGAADWRVGTACSEAVKLLPPDAKIDGLALLKAIAAKDQTAFNLAVWGDR